MSQLWPTLAALALFAAGCMSGGSGPAAHSDSPAPSGTASPPPMGNFSEGPPRILFQTQDAVGDLALQIQVRPSNASACSATLEFRGAVPDNGPSYAYLIRTGDHRLDWVVAMNRELVEFHSTATGHHSATSPIENRFEWQYTYEARFAYHEAPEGATITFFNRHVGEAAEEANANSNVTADILVACEKRTDQLNVLFSHNLVLADQTSMAGGAGASQEIIVPNSANHEDRIELAATKGQVLQFGVNWGGSGAVDVRGPEGMVRWSLNAGSPQVFDEIGDAGPYVVTLNRTALPDDSSPDAFVFALAELVSAMEGSELYPGRSVDG